MPPQLRRKPKPSQPPQPTTRPWTADERAAQGYDWWKFRGFRKVVTPEGLISDAKEAHKDLWDDPYSFPLRFRDRVAGYDFQGGPSLDDPAYTYPYPGTEVTPEMARRDFELAQRVAQQRRKPKR